MSGLYRNAKLISFLLAFAFLQAYGGDVKDEKVTKTRVSSPQTMEVLFSFLSAEQQNIIRDAFIQAQEQFNAQKAEAASAWEQLTPMGRWKYYLGEGIQEIPMPDNLDQRQRILETIVSETGKGLSLVTSPSSWAACIEKPCPAAMVTDLILANINFRDNDLSDFVTNFPNVRSFIIFQGDYISDAESGIVRLINGFPKLEVFGVQSTYLSDGTVHGICHALKTKQNLESVSLTCSLNRKAINLDPLSDLIKNTRIKYLFLTNTNIAEIDADEAKRASFDRFSAAVNSSSLINLDLSGTWLTLTGAPLVSKILTHNKTLKYFSADNAFDRNTLMSLLKALQSNDENNFLIVSLGNVRDSSFSGERFDWRGAETDAYKNHQTEERSFKEKLENLAGSIRRDQGKKGYFGPLNSSRDGSTFPPLFANAIIVGKEGVIHGWNSVLWNSVALKQWGAPFIDTVFD